MGARLRVSKLWHTLETPRPAPLGGPRASFDPWQGEDNGNIWRVHGAGQQAAARFLSQSTLRPVAFAQQRGWWTACDVTVHGSPQGRKGPPTHKRGGTQHNQAPKLPHVTPSPCQGTDSTLDRPSGNILSQIRHALRYRRSPPTSASASRASPQPLTGSKRSTCPDPEDNDP